MMAHPLFDHDRNAHCYRAGCVMPADHKGDHDSAPNDPQVRAQRLLGSIRMIATLGHGCGLVDPYPRESGVSPMTAVLDRLAETDPWLVDTWEYQQARERTSHE